MAPAGLVCPLRAVGAADRAVAGGKGASLGELHRAGLPVPPGFVVTVPAFRLAMQAADPRCAIDAELAALLPGDIATIERETAAIRARIVTAPIPADVTAAVNAAY